MGAGKALGGYGLGGGAPQIWGGSGRGTGPHRPPEAVSAPLPHLSAVPRAGCKGLSLGCPHAGTDVETEAKDRRDLSLPGHQLELLQDAVEAGRGSAPGQGSVPAPGGWLVSWGSGPAQRGW